MSHRYEELNDLVPTALQNARAPLWQASSNLGYLKAGRAIGDAVRGIDGAIECAAQTGNSPATMPAAGGKRPIFGRNPIAAVFPRNWRRRIGVDLTSSMP